MKFPWKQLLNAIFKPTPYIKPKCLICGLPLHSFPGSDVLMCDNGHKFSPGAFEKKDLPNSGDFHGDI